MTMIAHILMLVASFFASVAVGAAFTRMGGFDLTMGAFAGLTTFAVTCVLHGILTATRGMMEAAKQTRPLVDRVAKLEKSNAHLAEELALTRDGIHALAGRMEAIQTAEMSRPAPVVQQVQARNPGMEAEILADLVDRIGRTLDARLSALGIPQGEASTFNLPIESPIVRAVREALEDNRVELHLQPVVALPQRRTAFYEGFTRLKDANGRLIQPAEFLPAAQEAGLLSVIDNLLLFRCVQIVRRLIKQDRRIGIFCNLSAASLGDESFFPQFLDFMRENSDLAGALIFEVGQRDFDQRSSNEARAMARLIDLGFRFSIDKVERLDVDLNEYERSGIRFMKVGGQLLADSFLSGVRPFSNILREIEARDVSAVFSRHGVDLVAEKIEDEKTVIDILELGTPFGQGKLFGPPRPVKDSLMEDTAPPGDFLRRTA
jgi:cyclic-di-GMP phosphodiesterase, flagellum assembly factor TipF